jgi:Double sensory domain of two-component sensor kinase
VSGVLRSIRAKLIIPLVVGLTLIAVAIAVLMRFVHQRGVDQAALFEVQRASAALTGMVASEEDRLSALIDVIDEGSSLAESFTRGDRAALQAEAGALLKKLRSAHEVSHWYFHPADPNAGVFLRVHQPELFGDVVRRPSFRRAVATGAEARGIELGRTAYAVRVVRPWLVGGKVIGYLELGTDIHSFLVRLSRLTGDEFGVLLDKRQLDRKSWQRITTHPERWDERSELYEVASTGGGPPLSAGLEEMGQVPSQPALLGRETSQGRTWVRGVFPLLDDEGKTIGAVVERHEISALVADVDELRLQVVVLVVLLAAALAALVIFLLETLILEPVARMTKTLEELPERMATGVWRDLDGPPQSDDEMGRFEAFLDRAIDAVGSFVADARRAPGRPDDVDRRVGPNDP